MTDIEKAIDTLNEIAKSQTGLSDASKASLDELKLTLPADLEDNEYALNLFKHLCNVLEKE